MSLNERYSPQDHGGEPTHSTVFGLRDNRKHCIVNIANNSLMSTSRLRAVAIAMSNWFACPNRSTIDAGESSTSMDKIYTLVRRGNEI